MRERAYGLRRVTRLILATISFLILVVILLPSTGYFAAYGEELAPDVMASVVVRKGVLLTASVEADDVAVNVTAPDEASFQISTTTKQEPDVVDGTRLLSVERLAVLVEFD